MSYPKFCTKCGAPLEEGQNFCSICGAKVVSGNESGSESEQSSEDHSSDLVTDAPEQENDVLKQEASIDVHESSCSESDVTDEAAAALASLDLDDGLEEKHDKNEHTNPLTDSLEDADELVPSVPSDADIAASKTEMFSPVQAATTDRTEEFPTVPPRNDTQVFAPVGKHTSDGFAQAYVAPADTSHRTAGRSVLVTVIIVLSVLLVVLLGVLAFNYFGANASSGAASADDSAQSATVDTAGSDTEQASDTSSSQSIDSDELALYQTLSDYYDALSSYNQAIGQAAEDFNTYYLNKDMQIRSRYSGDVDTVLQELESDYNALLEVQVSSDSQYVESHRNLLTCYSDCVQRLSVISQSWHNSLAYTDPTGYSDEITAPIAADRVNGSNKYLTEFENTYPKAKPPEPDAEG